MLNNVFNVLQNYEFWKKLPNRALLHSQLTYMKLQKLKHTVQVISNASGYLVRI